jgi:hypothetical protein
MSQEKAIRDCFISPNVCDSNMEAANVVDAISNLANGAFAIRNAITPCAAPGSDGYGHVASLTEAVMGITHALSSIASALQAIADNMPTPD